MLLINEAKIGLDFKVKKDKIEIDIWHKDDKSDLKTQTFNLHEFIAEAITNSIKLITIERLINIKSTLTDELKDG